MTYRMSYVTVFCVLTAVTAAADDKKPATVQKVRHSITGLFSKDREADLRESLKELPEIKLVSIDFEKAEATFEYDPAKAFPGTKPDKIVEQFDNKLRTASRHTLGVKPLWAGPVEKLKRVEIVVAGLDCKACSLGAYEAVYKLPGVERATVNFKQGRMVAHIDPEQTDKTRLEDALMRRGVTIPGRKKK